MCYANFNIITTESKMPKIKTQNLLISVIAFFIVSIMLLFKPPDNLGAENLRESAVVIAVRKVSPVVVNISSEFEVRKQANPFSGFGIDPFFENFFNDFFDPGLEQRYKRTSLGYLLGYLAYALLL